MSQDSKKWQKYAEEYDPIKIGSIDGTDKVPHDRAIVRALNSEYTPDKLVKGDPECTVFVGRLNPRTTQIWKEMKQKVKKKFAAYKKSFNATGNAIAYIEMTEAEMKIISIMGTETSLGIDGVPEAGVEESFDVVFEQEVDEPYSEIQTESSAPAVAIDIVSETVQEPRESIDITPSIPRTEQIPQQQRTEETPQQTRPKKMTAEKLLAKSLQQSTESVAETIEKEFSKCGRVVYCRLVRDAVTGRSRRYAFVEFSRRDNAERALRLMHREFVDGAELLVEREAARRLRGWRPRRLGGGFGGHRSSGQLRFGCVDRPFQKPIVLDAPHSHGLESRSISEST